MCRLLCYYCAAADYAIVYLLDCCTVNSGYAEARPCSAVQRCVDIGVTNTTRSVVVLEAGKVGRSRRIIGIGIHFLLIYSKRTVKLHYSQHIVYQDQSRHMMLKADG